MLLTITTTHSPATDMGFLLEKHPAKVHEFELSAGHARVFYPEANDTRCTAALMLDVDPIGLVRSQAAKAGDAGLDQYVNDRPYVASSFMSVAIGVAFKSAMQGKSRHRPELAATAIPLEASLPVVPSRGGEGLLHALFEPLGYRVEATRHVLDKQFPEWGASPYYALKLTTVGRLQDLLRHLYVLIPVLDDRKHYWVGEAEVEKLLRHASEWLPDHPMKEWIARRYFKQRRSLAQLALEQLMTEDGDADIASDAEPLGTAAGEPTADQGVTRAAAAQEIALEKPASLNERRMTKVTELVSAIGVKSVVDLGCGEGRLLSRLLEVKSLDRIVGMDVSLRSLEHASQRLHLDRMAPRQRARIDLLHGSLVYRDDRLKGFDAATAIEVIEHLDPHRLAALERVLFEAARPTFIIVTTPNREYNVKFEGLAPGRFRHGDHRFEWTREEFRTWCARQCERFRYDVEYHAIGDEDPELGPPTQVALFSALKSN
jgi:3' terminal RNA ribose 2'-O-methyltransferase Hen1